MKTRCHEKDIIRVVDRQTIQKRLSARTATWRAFSAAAGTLRQAAVLVPLVEREGGIRVVLTRRTEHLRDHAGQISFPGGRIEPQDRSPLDAALREAYEEIGVPPEAIELVGSLPRYTTGTGFAVYPFVGFLSPEARFKAEPEEVAEVFEVPLTFILDAANHRPHVVEHEGRRYHLSAIPYGDYYIWGATAGILKYLYELIKN